MIRRGFFGACRSPGPQDIVKFPKQRIIDTHDRVYIKYAQKALIYCAFRQRKTNNKKWNCRKREKQPKTGHTRMSVYNDSLKTKQNTANRGTKK